MKIIATEILGLEWDEDKGESEVFEIDAEHHKGFTFYFTPNGLTGGGESRIHELLLVKLLSEQYKIKKLPKKWKPELRSIFYYPRIDRPYGYEETIWNDHEYDNFLYTNSLVFATKEEAIEESKLILKLRELEAEK